ncbi:sensor histidine kinase [Legionella impletisoli]|uniref:histidine kinase n=1 Tax=Legionella impletisoli TaxID=343510 RepID=A0A917JQD9_9GAMM|nr:ATP-binding protein [Legionella impletisoli]GGI81682.1 hypothetical protein GCM10007966_07730 [Legionella impletisoli]
MLKSQITHVNIAHFFSVTLAVLVGLVGLSGIIAWFIQFLPSLEKDYYFTKMSIEELVAFSLSSLGLLFYCFFPKSRLTNFATIIGAFVFLIGFAFLVKYFVGFSLGDVWALKETWMAPNAALCFVIMGVVLLSLNVSLTKKLYFYPLLLLTLIILFSSLVLLDYSIHFSSTYGWGSLSNMTLLSALLFLLWSLSAWIFLFQETQKTIISNQTYILPLVAFVLVSLASIGLFELLAIKERNDLRKAIASFLPQVETTAKEVVELQHKALQRMIKRIQSQHITLGEEWESDAKDYLKDNHEFMILALLNENLSPRVYESKLSPDNTMLLLQQIKQSFFPTTTSHFVGAPFQSINHDLGSWIFFPFSLTGERSGYLAIYYNYHSLFADLLSPVVKKLIYVKWRYQDRVVYQNAETQLEFQSMHWEQQHQLILNGYPFTLTVWPTQLFIDKYLSLIPAGFLVFSLIFALLFATLAHYWQLLQTSKKHLQRIIDSVNIGIYGLNSKGETTFYNQAGAEMVGYTSDETLGRIQHLLTHHSYPDGTHYPAEQCPIYASFKDGHSRVNDSEVFWRKDGTSFPVEYRSEPIFNEQGKLIGAVVSFFDITERKRMKEQIEERNAALEASNQELEAFSYSVSHDLKAPLRHIIGFIDLMKQDQNNQFSREGERYLSVISKAAEKMSHLIDDLLKFSRVGRASVNKQKISLNRLMNELEEEFQSEIKARNISIHYRDLPTVFADENLMRSVLMNLIGNAIKFTARQKKPLIVISSNEKEDVYEIAVQDNGVGFEPQYHHKIFETFQRLHPASEFEGTGIGLAIVAKIIKRHGGRVWAESEINKGTTIYFTIPKRMNHDQ